MSILKLKMELEDVKQEASEAAEALANIRDEKATEAINTAIQVFKNHMEGLGFSLEKKQISEINGSSRYNVDLFEASYKNLKYTLNVPDVRGLFIGTINVLTITELEGEKENKIAEILVIADFSGARGSSHVIPQGEEERCRFEIERARKSLVESKDKAEKLKNGQSKIVFKIKEDASLYEDFKDVLNKVINS